MINRTKIEQIVKLYKEEFPMGWLSGYDWSLDNSETSLESVKDKVNSFDQDFFYLFAQSVLAGEFHIRKDFPQTLDGVYELLTSGEVYVDETNQFITVAARFFNDMLYLQAEVIRNLRYLLTILYNKYEERPTKYILNAYRVKHDSTKGNFGRYYDILIDVTRIDHFLSYDKRTISDLIIYHAELSKGLEDKNLPSKIIQVLDVLNKKSLFLLKKLLVDESRVFDFMIDFKHKQYDTGKIDLGYLKGMDKYFEFYRAENYSNDELGNELDIRARNNALPIGQYSLLMKYYKDSKSTQKTQIDNIIKEFDESYEKLSAQFTMRPLDRYALGTLKNYMYNCRFSFLMQNEAYSFEQLQNDLNRIIGIQYQTKILNFYPYRKAFEKALMLLHKDETHDKSVLNEYKRFLELCIAKFSEAMQWCKENWFYPIQNCYNECLVPVTGFGAVFIASSFCRPVRYDNLKEELNTFRNQALLVDNEIALREEKADLKSLKKDIDNTRTKEIEILSVFTAIITFLFGSIGFFADNRNNDFPHLIYSIIGLGAILMIFVCGIHLVTMRKEEHVVEYFKHPRSWFCFVTIIVSVVLLFYMLSMVNSLQTS